MCRRIRNTQNRTLVTIFKTWVKYLLSLITAPFFCIYKDMNLQKYYCMLNYHGCTILFFPRKCSRRGKITGDIGEFPLSNLRYKHFSSIYLLVLLSKMRETKVNRKLRNPIGRGYNDRERTIRSINATKRQI